LSRYAFKDPLKHWYTAVTCYMTTNESSNVSTCLMPMELRICRPNKMALYSAWLLLQKYSKWDDVSKMAPLGEIKTTHAPWPSLYTEPSKNNFYG
jgi:hypothetical protein